MTTRGRKRKAEEIKSDAHHKEQKVFTASKYSWATATYGIGFAMPVKIFADAYRATPFTGFDYPFTVANDVITLRGTIRISPCASHATHSGWKDHLNKHLCINDLTLTSTSTKQPLGIHSARCTCGRPGLHLELLTLPARAKSDLAPIPGVLVNPYFDSDIEAEAEFLFNIITTHSVITPAATAATQTLAEQWRLVEPGTDGDITFRAIDGDFKAPRVLVQANLPFLGLYKATKAGSTEDGVIHVDAALAILKLVVQAAVAGAVLDVSNMKMQPELDQLMTAARYLMLGESGFSPAYAAIEKVVAARLLTLGNTFEEAIPVYAFAKKFEIAAVVADLSARVRR